MPSGKGSLAWRDEIRRDSQPNPFAIRSVTALSSFEVLAQPLIPPLPTPPGAQPPQAVPYALQAYFVQVSYPKEGSGSGQGANPASIQFNLVFQETTGFKNREQAVVLAQFIDENGDLQTDGNFLSSNPSVDSGYMKQQILPGQTKIYSLTVLPKTAPGEAVAATPQSGIGWRGTVFLQPNSPDFLIATPTQRQIYYTSATLMTVTDSVVYPVPTFSGKTQI